MNFIQIYLFVILFFKLGCSPVSEKERSSPGQKGVYVITVQSEGPAKNSGRTRLSDDSIFVIKDLAIEKVMKTNQLEYGGKLTLTESVGGYYLIDLKKRVFKDLGTSLDKSTDQIPWQDLRNKTTGHIFHYGWFNDEPHVLKDTLYDGKNIRQLSYTSTKDKFKYVIYLENNVPKNNMPVFFIGIEDKFDLSLIELRASNDQGTILFTKRFIPMDDHEVLRKIIKCSEE